MRFYGYKHQLGLTLYEILVASAISAIVATTIGSLFVSVTRHFQSLARQNLAQQELQLISYHLHSIFGQSLNNKIEIKKHAHNTGISKAPNSSNAGDNYSCGFWGGNCGNKYGDTTPDGDLKVKVVSIELQRVTGFLTADSDISKEEPETTYIYFIEPFSNKPGVLCLIFDVEAAKAITDDNTNMWKLHSNACRLSSDSALVLEVDRYAVGFQLLGLEIELIKTSDDGNEHKLADFTLHDRYFLSSSASGVDLGFRYCGSSDQNQECKTKVSYKDMSQKVQVGLRNNICEDWSMTNKDCDEIKIREGSYGRILFYRMGLPANSYLTRSKN